MQLKFDFSGGAPVLKPLEEAPESNDYHRVPATEKQIAYARMIAAKLKQDLPEDVLADRASLSQWIESHKGSAMRESRGGAFANYPSSKQVAFAERIARAKRRAVPPECFKDRTLMSRWIDGNR